MVRWTVCGTQVDHPEHQLQIALRQERARLLPLTGEHQSTTSRSQHLVALSARTLKRWIQCRARKRCIQHRAFLPTVYQLGRQR